MDRRLSRGSGRRLVTGQDQTSEWSKGLGSRRAIDLGTGGRGGEGELARHLQPRSDTLSHFIDSEMRKDAEGGSVPESLKAPVLACQASPQQESPPALHRASSIVWSPVQASLATD